MPKRSKSKAVKMGLETRVLSYFFFICFAVYLCKAEIVGNSSVAVKDDEFIGRMIEEGRTMVHHAVKRFMIILPAIFFKLGVAFTLLVLVAIVAVNNGFIGFMLLVVGLSSVLARLQDSSKKHVVPYYLPQTHHHVAYRDWDRSDRREEREEKVTTETTYPTYNQQYLYTPLSTYNPGYYGQKV